MTSSFSINNHLYPLTKGDIAGHPFHGNQFTAGNGSVKVNELRTAGNSLSYMHQGENENGVDYRAIASGHTALANAYGQRVDEIGKQYDDLMASGKTEEEVDKILGNAYMENETAQENHKTAASANSRAGSSWLNDDERSEAESDAEDATNRAANQGETAIKAEQSIPAKLQSKTL